jgi:2'-5' RNA ligase
LSKSLYFLAIVPEDPIQEEITGFKKKAAKRFGSKHALKSPAHITIIPPFFWADEKTSDLRAALTPVISKHPPFKIEIDGFDRFDKRVIYVKPILTKVLKKLHFSIKDICKDELDIPLKSGHPFNPHFTIAFKDLKKAMFPEAWSYFQNLSYQRSFEARGVCLLRHNGERWEERESLLFKVRS